MTTNERMTELKKIMNIGFETENNYVSNKIGTVSWIVDKDFNETCLLMAVVAKNLNDKILNELECYPTLKEFGDTEYKCFKILEEDYGTLIEIECIEWTDQTETMIRIHSWEDDLSEQDPQSKSVNKELGDLITEFVAQQLEM